MKHTYTKEIAICQEDLVACNRPIILLGTLKVLTFFAIPITYFIGYAQEITLLPTTLIALVWLILFLYGSKKQEQYKIRERKNKGLIAIHEANLQRLDGSWNQFIDTGAEFIDYEHPYAMDLDIVGDSSLFQYCNSTHSYFGRKQLAHDLLDANYDKDAIKLRQQAIAEISDMYQYTSTVEYACSSIQNSEVFRQLTNQLQQQEPFFKQKKTYSLLRILCVTTIIVCLIAAFTEINYLILLSTLLLTLQLGIWFVLHKKAESYVHVVKEVSSSIEAYVPVIDAILGTSVKSKNLQNIHTQLIKSKEIVSKLASIASNINQTQNALASFILNLFWLWDIKNAHDLAKWKQLNSKQMALCFDAVATYETYVSFANIKRNVDHACLPTIEINSKKMHATQIGHPLILNKKRISNDFHLDDEIMIISGSNMSGKTTFLRTVGINMVLAKAGSYVVADHMNCPLVQILTSMRIRDDLNAGVSTFYAELQRIKMIIDASSKEANTCFFIDEIFKGTNSVDRLYGAKAVLKQLNQDGVIGFISTHDLEVCSYEKHYPRIINYSFNETYTKDTMSFDYTIKPGISKSTNAQFLLKKVGIVKEPVIT